MYKKGKAQKGITLIALVITIIVMLILVGVTITMAVNGGLFNYAGNAVRATNTRLQEEGELSKGGIEVNGIWYDSIDKYLNKSTEGYNLVLNNDDFSSSVIKFSLNGTNTWYSLEERTDYFIRCNFDCVSIAGVSFR